jgi:hypothetical protein
VSQQDTVDIVALGRAQRKIQAIVEKSLERKKLGTRSKIARWQESNTTVNEQNADGVATGRSADPTAEEEVAIPALSLTDLDLDLETLEKEGWGVSYDLPFVDGGKQDVD